MLLIPGNLLILDWTEFHSLRAVSQEKGKEWQCRSYRLTLVEGGKVQVGRLISLRGSCGCNYGQEDVGRASCSDDVETEKYIDG